MKSISDWMRAPFAPAMTALFIFGSPVAAFEGTVAPEAMERAADYSPYAGRAYPDLVLFGDLHFHTELSFDAGLVGTSLTVHDAMRVARGEKIVSNTGQPVQLIRPLDFLAITEHAEMLGVATALNSSDPRLMADETGRRFYDLFTSGQEGRCRPSGRSSRQPRFRGWIRLRT